MARWSGVRRIVSGGQTGVDRAALDIAIELGIDHGGWCPAGRWAEDGPVPSRYRLRQTEPADPAERTRRNVRDSDGTLVFGELAASPGTALTVEIACELGRPCWIVRPKDPPRDAVAGDVRAWLSEHAIATLNVAGPRASEAELGDLVRRILREVLAKRG